MDAIVANYARPHLAATLDRALRAAGIEPSEVAAADISAFDEFHTRGHEATLELAELAAPLPGERVIDLGCGLGGPARHLAAAHGCEVVGIDLTPEYVALARDLARRTGLDAKVRFELADATALPFADGSFDLAWTQHVAMNVAEKDRLYAEAYRVLRPGGRLALHDVLAGAGGAPVFPVPWAGEAAISHLVDASTLERLLGSAGFEVLERRDRTAATAAWIAAQREAARLRGAPPVSLRLLFGEDGPARFANLARNLEEGRIGAHMLLARRPG